MTTKLTETMKRQLVLKVAFAYLGTPYRWGGDDPSAFDCSGLAIECLRSVGLFPRKQDTTADGLRRRYSEISEQEVRPGDLVFWLNDSDQAIHVGIIFEDGVYIGAEGGGSRTLTEADAWRHNAYIQLNTIESRGTPETRRFASPY